MASEALDKYINKRYDRWLDYAKYHTSLAGIGDEASDVLNEVMAMLLEKPEEEINLLLNRKHGKYTELDFYVLQMIKLNATSDTSPYRHKYKAIPADDNVDWRRLNIIDEPDQSFDKAAYISEKMHEVRAILDSLDLSEKAIQIFSWKFFSGESYSDWLGEENSKELYSVYKQVFRMLMQRKEGKMLL